MQLAVKHGGLLFKNKPINHQKHNMKINQRHSFLAALALALAGLPAAEVAAQTGRSAARSKTISIDNIVDMTHTLTPDFPYNPVSGYYFPFRATTLTTIKNEGSNARRWDIHEHIGTQIDAPIHFHEGGITLEKLDVNTLIAPLAVIDIRERARRDPDALLTVDDIKAWEKQHGRLPEGAAVFLWSGWDAKIKDAKAFVNLDAKNTMHFPGFAPAAVEFLLRERNVVGIGTDTLSPDVGPSTDFPIHKAWHAAGKWNVECVANLGQVPPAGATVFVGASKVVDAAGGLVRLIATYPNAAGRNQTPGSR